MIDAHNFDMATFVKERNEALLSLDEGRIRDYLDKYNGHRGSPIIEVFWGGVHKAITGCNGLPIEFRQKSKTWLIEHGYMSLDDGELQ